jgi:polyisoprenyl-phosphate glycosyltransferase
MQNNMKPLNSISVVIPIFNSEKVLEELFQRIIVVLENLNLDAEIIAVDDGSQDNSWAELIRIKSNTRIPFKLIRLSKNYGQHHALLCGIKHSSKEAVITIDDDLEYFPEDIPLLIEKYNESGTQLVYGIPRKKNISVFRKILVSIYRRLAKIRYNRGVGSSFRLLSRSLANSITTHENPFIFIDELCLWYTSNLETITVRHAQSKRQASNYSTPALLRLTSNLIFISSTYPLRIVTTLGTLLMVFNFGFGSYYIIRKLFFSIAIPGYTSLIVSILFSTGLILFALGIMAQYLSKILLLNFGKPSYHIAEEK